MPKDNPLPENGSKKTSAYAGRWVARLKDRIVGQGGTPEHALQAAKSTRHKENPQVSFVNSTSPLSFSPLFDQVKDILSKDKSIYLVGGAIRDAVLNIPSHDLDFALQKGAQKTARKVANALQASYYSLDDEHEAGRVVVVDEDGTRQIIDFAVFRGDDLEADLRGRDFTINAMAVDIQEPQELLDPLGGISDLFHKQIRPCSDSSFKDDPLRTLRAVRLAAKFKFKILGESKKGIRDSVSGLRDVSVERIRDELFKILDAPNPDISLRVMELLGILPYVLPELERLKGVKLSDPPIDDLWEYSLQTVKQMSKILKELDIDYRHDNEDGGNLATGLIAQKLGRYRKQFTVHLQKEFTPERKFRPLLLLTALYHAIDGIDANGKQTARDRAKGLHLSNVEIVRFGTILKNQSRPDSLMVGEQIPSRLEIYKYFKETDEAGVSITFLSLAKLLAHYGKSVNHVKLEKLLVVLRALLEAYWEHYETDIDPPTLLDGKEMMKIIQLSEGPQIGELIEKIREAQITGEIKTKKDAIEFVNRKIEEKDK